MSKIPLRSIVLGIIVIFFTGVIFYLLNSNFTFNIFNLNSKKDTFNDVSGSFNKLLSDQQEEASRAANFVQNSREFNLGWGYEVFDFEAAWNYPDTPFLAKIINISKENSTLTLEYSGPKDMPFVDTKKAVESVSCNSENTYLTYDATNTTSNKDLDFFSTATVGDDLIGYCLDEQCTTIGKLCKIIRYGDK